MKVRNWAQWNFLRRKLKTPLGVSQKLSEIFKVPSLGYRAITSPTSPSRSLHDPSIVRFWTTTTTTKHSFPFFFHFLTIVDQQQRTTQGLVRISHTERHVEYLETEVVHAQYLETCTWQRTAEVNAIEQRVNLNGARSKGNPDRVQSRHIIRKLKSASASKCIGSTKAIASQ